MSGDTGRPIQKLCIVGGGTAGWISAALLSHYAGSLLEIRLVESEEIGTIGVGESTIPPFLQMLARLGVSESDFIRDTQASFKLGIRFDGWKEFGSSYFHPFGVFGAPNPPIDPYQLWLRARASDPSLPLQALAPASVMASAGKFMLPFKAANTPVGGASYALHVDAKRVAGFLRRFAEQRGVLRTEGIVEKVEADGDQVQALLLRSGERIEADFFLDCSGFRALLLGDALGVSLEDWSDLLLCDRAVVVQTENRGPPPPFTLAEAQPAGWRWRIPLQHRTGNGHVFSSKHMDPDAARSILLEKVEGDPVTDPALLRFTTGARREMWRGNVVAIGLAAGFIEPLESTAIHLGYRAIDFLLRYFPSTSRAPHLAAEFNRRMFDDYVEIRDFIIAHYSLTKRADTAFWRDVAAIRLPETLQHRVAMFADGGMLPELLDGLFSPVSWQSVLDGMGVVPRRPHPSVSTADADALARDLRDLATAIERTVQQLPSHQAFLDQHCRAPDPVAA
jgi:tryptophan halogenase